MNEIFTKNRQQIKWQAENHTRVINTSKDGQNHRNQTTTKGKTPRKK